MVAAMCSAPSQLTKVKLTEMTPCCPGAGTMNKLGKPRVMIPCRVAGPAAHLSARFTPPRPMICVGGTPGERRHLGLEAGGVDETVELVILSVADESPWGHPFDAGRAIDEGHVGQVEGRQVFVVEAGPLAEVAVIGLQDLGIPGDR